MITNPLLNRSATFILETIGNTLWGFKPNLMSHFVDQHGPVKSVTWFATNMPKYEKILKEWGPIRTHLIASAISTLNGCLYCTAGHAYAFQLHYLQTYDRLFPLDENQMFGLHELGREGVIEALERALVQADLAAEIPPMERMAELYDDPSLATSSEDSLLVHLIQMFATLNQCGIQSQATVDQVHDPINRDTALWALYTELRQRQESPQESRTALVA